MLRRTSGLSRPVLKWASQVLASLGATLSATLIWSAVPHPGAAPAAQALVSPELTSGGKFAARAVQPVAYDGLDTMPLPRVAPVPARFVLASLDAAPPRMLHRAAGNEAPVAAAVAAAVPERRIVRPARAPLHAELRRAEPAVSAAPVAQPVVAPAVVASEPAPEVGLLRRMLPAALPSSLTSLVPPIMPSIASTAREAWSVTASAGDALVEHVVPRMP